MCDGTPEMAVINICVTSLGHTEKNKKYLHQFYTKLVCKMGAHTYQEALAFDKKAIKPQEATNFMVVGPNWCSYMSGVHLSWEQNDKRSERY